MASKRMFATAILRSDNFCDLPFPAQALYVQLNLAADDDGIVGSAKTLIRSLGIQKKNLELLCDTGYILRLSDGVYAITHWHVHNNIRCDRYTESYYQKEVAKLKISKNKTYKVLDFPSEIGDFGMQNVSGFAPQDSIEEEREEEDNREYSIQEESSEPDEKTDTSSPDKKSVRSYSDSLTPLEKEKYRHFLHEVDLYFLGEYKSLKSAEFIEYNEKRFWHGRDGESVIDNYKFYIDEWIRREGHFE